MEDNENKMGIGQQIVFFLMMLVVLYFVGNVGGEIGATWFNGLGF